MAWTYGTVCELFDDKVSVSEGGEKHLNSNDAFFFVSSAAIKMSAVELYMRFRTCGQLKISNMLSPLQNEQVVKVI